MRARYTGNAWGMWKGLALEPGKVFDIPEALQEIVARNPNFEVLPEGQARRGRPPKVNHGNPA